MKTDMAMLAQRLLSNLDKPFLFVEEVTEITGLSGAHIRMLVKRGNLKIPDTPPAERGHGKRGLYPFTDLIEILTVAELSRLGVNPIIKDGPRQWKSFANPVAESVKLFLKSHADGAPVENKFRYVVIYFDQEISCLEGDFMTNPFEEKATSDENTRCVVNCERMARKILDAFRKYQGGLTR